jgi:predicted outer membrane repeat protein
VALDDPRLDAPGAGAGLRVCGGGSEADDADCIDLATMFGREPGGATAEADLDELADAACTSGWSVVELYALADTSCGASTVRALSGVSLVLDCDDDGYDQLVDCDDGDATRFPGQVEQCDEVDHDCSGEAYDVVEYTAAGSPAAVPLEQLQSALDAADPGTAVEVCGGTHVGPLVWPLGGVSLSSAHGAVLDGGKAGSVITYLPAQEPPETRPVVKLTNVTLTNGLAADGGGLHTVHGRVELVDVIVQGNTATGSGGGIHAEGSQLQGVSLMVSGNVAADGGGLHLMGSELDAIASEVEGNQATTMGGGVMLRDGLVLLDVASMVRGNEAPLGGGVAGVLMRAEVRAGVEGGRISDNVADLGGAFATSSDGGAAAIELTDVTFEGNEAREQGGVIYALQPVRLEGSSSSSSVVPFPHDGQVAFVSGATGQLEVVCNTMESSTYANDDGLLPPPPPPCGTMAGTGTAWVEDTTCSCN